MCRGPRSRSLMEEYHVFDFLYVPDGVFPVLLEGGWVEVFFVEVSVHYLSRLKHVAEGLSVFYVVGDVVVELAVALSGCEYPSEGGV